MSPNEVRELTGQSSRKRRYFYGWNIVGASFMANLSYAQHFTSLLGFFIRPLQTEFGWGRTAIAAVQTIARVVEALLAPLVGPLIDRYGPRVLMVIGGVIVGVTMLWATQISAIWQFYMLRGVLVAVGFTLMGNLVSGVAINNWFIRKRGRAIAIARLGSNMSNVIFVPVTVFVIAASGWRTMFVIFAVLTWLVVVIPSAIIMRRRPEDMGMYPDGTAPVHSNSGSNRETIRDSGNEIVSEPEPLWSRREALGAKAFWLLSAALGINNMAFQGINISLAPYIQDLNYSEAMLASVMTFRAIMAAFSLPLAGFLAEHANRLSVRVGPFIIQGIAITLLIFAENPVLLWVGVAMYGFGISAVGIVQEVIWANFFGRLSLGTVRSLSFLVAFGFGASGPIAMNAVFDFMKSYHPAFIVIICLFAVSAFVMAVVRPPQASRFATAGGIIAE